MEQKLTAYFNNVGRRYLNRLSHDFYKYLDIARDKQYFIQQQITKARALHLTIQGDPYQSRIVEIIQEGMNLRQSLDQMMPRILKEREHWHNQQYYGIEYNQDYYPVADFVEEKNEIEITRFITRYAIYMKLYAEVLEPELKKLQEHAGEQPREFTDEQRTKERQAVADMGKQVAGYPHTFKWIGKQPKEQIKKLYTSLNDAGLIGKETTAQAFAALFAGDQLKERIRWTGTNSLLLYLFTKLAEDGYIHVPGELDEHLGAEEKTRAQRQQFSAWLYRHLIYCFTDAARKSYTNANLKDANKSQSKSKAGKPEKFEIIDTILNSL